MSLLTFYFFSKLSRKFDLKKVNGTNNKSFHSAAYKNISGQYKVQITEAGNLSTIRMRQKYTRVNILRCANFTRGK